MKIEFKIGRQGDHSERMRHHIDESDTNPGRRQRETGRDREKQTDRPRKTRERERRDIIPKVRRRWR